MKLNTGAKEIQSGKSCWARQTAKASGPHHLINAKSLSRNHHRV